MKMNELRNDINKNVNKILTFTPSGLKKFCTVLYLCNRFMFN